MLPRSTTTRSGRNGGGRAKEIERLVGRSLRAAVDLQLLGPRTITIDCDVIQADGGTRTAAITGGFVALAIAIRRLKLAKDPIRMAVAAISVGIIDNELRLDLPYAEDSIAEVDMNIVMTKDERLIEVQGTAEQVRPAWIASSSTASWIWRRWACVNFLSPNKRRSVARDEDPSSRQITPARCSELRALVAPLGVEVVTLADIGVTLEVDEDQLTFAGNAEKKARAAVALTKMAVIADDSGLEVDALDGAPGIYSARYAGAGHDDAANNRKLIAALADVPLAARTARFRCALAFVDVSGHAETAEGACEGSILPAARGPGGLWVRSALSRGRRRQNDGRTFRPTRKTSSRIAAKRCVRWQQNSRTIFRKSSGGARLQTRRSPRCRTRWEIAAASRPLAAVVVGERASSRSRLPNESICSSDAIPNSSRIFCFAVSMLWFGSTSSLMFEAPGWLTKFCVASPVQYKEGRAARRRAKPAREIRKKYL